VGVVFSRLLQTVKLQRDAFVWMDFNDRATGDAAILVAITQVLLALGTGTPITRLLNPINLISVLISGLFFWVIYSGATYLIARYLLEGHGTYAIYLRITGFAYPTLLLLIAANVFLDNFLLILLVGAAWFVIIVANGLNYTVDLPIQRAFAAAVGGYIAITIIQAILASVRIF
jgi:Yip1 domain